MSGAVVALPDADAAAEAAAERIAVAAAEAVRARGRFLLGLSGGSTPAQLYRLLTGEPWRDRVPWPATHIFFADERCVPPDDERSNYRLVREQLLDPLPIPPANVHRWRGEDPDPARAARDYAANLVALAGEPPRLDLLLLGMGADGHTASLFPGSPTLAARGWTAADPEPRAGVPRLTLTLATINAARQVVFLVTGAEKRATLSRVLHEPGCDLPAARVRPADSVLVWLVDEAAWSGDRG